MHCVVRSLFPTQSVRIVFMPHMPIEKVNSPWLFCMWCCTPHDIMDLMILVINVFFKILVSFVITKQNVLFFFLDYSFINGGELMFICKTCKQVLHDLTSELNLIVLNYISQCPKYSSNAFDTRIISFSGCSRCAISSFYHVFTYAPF